MPIPPRSDGEGTQPSNSVRPLGRDPLQTALAFDLVALPKKKKIEEREVKNGDRTVEGDG